jgi:serine/threonine-protein kinase HipA
MPVLDVWLYGRRAGRLAQSGGKLRFAYDPDYAQGEQPPLSRSLPLRAEPFDDASAHSFFANLLPEGHVRRHLASRLGISVENDFDLLTAVGGDCAGAVSLLPLGASPERAHDDAVRWLDEAELAQTIADLPRKPLFADPEDGIRLSLAGAQDKLPVVVLGDRIGLPEGDTPSTHIIKAPIEPYEGTNANEAFCLALARELAIVAAEAGVRSAGSQRFLLVERYDRRFTGERYERLHQEDFCQAVGIPPELKYENEGGPGLAACFDLLRAAASVPARDLPALLDAVTLNFLIGNHDAHGKNFSLLYDADGSTRLAPLYDLVSTVVYPGLSRKMAMKIGGEYRPDYVRRRHIDRFAEAAGLGPAAVRRRMLFLAEYAPRFAHALRERTAAEAADAATLDRIVGVVAERSRHLSRELESATG